jgi:integrase
MVDGYVFCRDAGRPPWRPNWVTKRFIAYHRRAGLAAHRLHDFRHFMATTVLAAGVLVPVVSERLSHAPNIDDCQHLRPRHAGRRSSRRQSLR